MANEAKTPTKSESNGKTFHKPNTRTKAGPDIMEMHAYFFCMRPLHHKAQHSGTKIVAPRSPMDIKAKFNIVSPKGPIESRQAAKIVTTISIRSVFLPKTFSLALPFANERTSFLRTVAIPSAKPYPRR